jgi:hypothetical protein
MMSEPPPALLAVLLPALPTALLPALMEVLLPVPVLLPRLLSMREAALGVTA